MEARFKTRELVVDGVGAAFWKQGRPVELDHFLFNHAPHQIRSVHLMDSLPVSPVEAVRIDQGHERLEILVPTVVRGGSHEEQVPGQTPEHFADQVSLDLVQLVTEVVGRHLVGLVHDDQVPIGVVQLALQVLGAGQLIDTSNEQIPFIKGIPGAESLNHLTGENIETEPELEVHFVMPLFDQISRGDDEASLEVATDHEFPDEQARHDGLACAWVVSQKEAEGLPGQHGFVDGRDLVGKRIDVRGVNCHQGIKKVRQMDAVSLRGQFEVVGIAIKAPGPPDRLNAQIRLV